jgi:poly(3-hydroxybutyrate) depolymerase
MKSPMHRSTSLVVTAALMALSGCAAANNDASIDTEGATTTPAVTTTVASTAPATQPSPAVVVPPGYESITTADGRVRSYRVSDLSDGEPAPLLFVLHGIASDAQTISDYTNIEDSLDAYDLDAVVVYPNGTGAEQDLFQSWNAGTCCPFAMFELVDDVAFFDELITSLITQYEIDTTRVWVVGHSNGGMMAYRLACELSTRITAIGVAAGALAIDSCSPSRPVSALHVHGELDTVVPLTGGNSLGIVFPSTQLSVETFALANNGDIELVTDAKWSHDWQPEWSELFARFLASK